MRKREAQSELDCNAFFTSFAPWQCAKTCEAEKHDVFLCRGQWSAGSVEAGSITTSRQDLLCTRSIAFYDFRKDTPWNLWTVCCHFAVLINLMRRPHGSRLPRGRQNGQEQGQGLNGCNRRDVSSPSCKFDVFDVPDDCGSFGNIRKCFHFTKYTLLFLYLKNCTSFHSRSCSFFCFQGKSIECFNCGGDHFVWALEWGTDGHCFTFFHNHLHLPVSASALLMRPGIALKVARARARAEKAARARVAQTCLCGWLSLLDSLRRYESFGLHSVCIPYASVCSSFECHDGRCLLWLQGQWQLQVWRWVPLQPWSIGGFSNPASGHSNRWLWLWNIRNIMR